MRKRAVVSGRTDSAGRARASRWWSALLIATWFAFFAQPLFSPKASIQWDAVDVHYSSQKYFADELKAGRLPDWTPYIFSGFPFLADPQVGAFYPLNWPFMVVGISPKSIQAELALHSLLAATGVFMFLRLWLSQTWAAGLGGFAYAFSGFFAGHASHVGMYQAACLWPWLLYCAERALRGPSVPAAAGAGAVAGLTVLAGHPQTALYGGSGLVLYLVLRLAIDRSVWKKTLGLLAVTSGLAFLISSVILLPGAELTSHSIRAHQDYRASQEGTLHLAALATLVAPDALGARTSDYRGPGDRTQYYFYGGLLLLPLVALALVDFPRALIPGIMAIVAVWFMLGPAAGLFRLAAIAPGFARFRAPVHAWFIAAFALCWLAAIGAELILRRFTWDWLGPVLCALMALDLCAENSWANPLAYARESFDVLYGRGVLLLRDQVAPVVPAGMRFAAPDRLPVFGSMNSPLEVRLETTYGYNPLELHAYAQYRALAQANPRLLDALAVSHELDVSRGGIIARSTALPKAWFPARVRSVSSSAESLATLRDLDPRVEAIVAEREIRAADGAVVERITSKEREWIVQYRAIRGGLLVLSLPHYPGWRAELGTHVLPLLRVNHALSGVVVPGGSGQLRLRFRSRWLGTGAALSLLGCCLTGVMCLLQRAGRRVPPSHTELPEQRWRGASASDR